MPHTFDMDAKRNGALALLDKSGALGLLIACDSFADGHGNFWASTRPDKENPGALNQATGRSHTHVVNKRRWLRRHGAIVPVPAAAARLLYQDNKKNAPPDGVTVWHLTGELQPCGNPECGCQKFIHGVVKIFYTGRGDACTNFIHKDIPDSEDTPVEDISGAAAPAPSPGKEGYSATQSRGPRHTEEGTPPGVDIKESVRKEDSGAATPAPSGNGQTPPGEKKLTAWQEQLKAHALVLCEIAGVDYEVNKKQAGQVAAPLIKAGYTIAQYHEFARWWYTHDWRGQKKQRPSLWQVKTEIAKAFLPPPRAAPSAPGTIPPHLRKDNRADIRELTDEQRAAVRQAIREAEKGGP